MIIQGFLFECHTGAGRHRCRCDTGAVLHQHCTGIAEIRVRISLSGLKLSDLSCCYRTTLRTPLQSPLWTTLKTEYKTIIKTSLTASPINHSCGRNFERYAEKNVNEKCIKTPKTMFKSCFRGEDTDGKKEKSSCLLFLA